LATDEDVDFEFERWNELCFEWNDVIDKEIGTSFCKIFLNNVKLGNDLPLALKNQNGISYIHFISCEENDPSGLLISDLSFTQIQMRETNTSEKKYSSKK
jgi:hypothetical protein